MLCCDILNAALANSAHEYITKVKVCGLGSIMKNRQTYNIVEKSLIFSVMHLSCFVKQKEK